MDVMSIHELGQHLRDVLRMAQAPLAQNQSSKFVGFRLVESMADSMDELATEMSVTRSVLIREAISEYLAARREVAA